MPRFEESGNTQPWLRSVQLRCRIPRGVLKHMQKTSGGMSSRGNVRGRFCGNAINLDPTQIHTRIGYRRFFHAQDRTDASTPCAVRLRDTLQVFCIACCCSTSSCAGCRGVVNTNNKNNIDTNNCNARSATILAGCCMKHKRLRPPGGIFGANPHSESLHRQTGDIASSPLVQVDGTACISQPALGNPKLCRTLLGPSPSAGPDPHAASRW